MSRCLSPYCPTYQHHCARQSVLSGIWMLIVPSGNPASGLALAANQNIDPTKYYFDWSSCSRAMICIRTCKRCVERLLLRVVWGARTVSYMMPMSLIEYQFKLYPACSIRAASQDEIDDWPRSSFMLIHLPLGVNYQATFLWFSSRWLHRFSHIPSSREHPTLITLFITPWNHVIVQIPCKSKLKWVGK